MLMVRIYFQVGIVVATHEFTPYGTPPRRAEFLPEPHPAFFLRLVPSRGSRSLFNDLRPFQLYDPTCSPTNRFSDKKDTCKWMFLFTNFILVCSVWALRYVTDVALLFLFQNQNILIIYLLIGATRILLWCIYVFMIMFRALVNCSRHEPLKDN